MAYAPHFPPVNGDAWHLGPQSGTGGPGEESSARRWERSPGHGDRCRDLGTGTSPRPTHRLCLPPHSGLHFPGEHGIDLEGDEDRVPGERGVSLSHRGTAAERGSPPRRTRGGPESRLRSARALLFGWPVGPERGEAGRHGARPPSPPIPGLGSEAFMAPGGALPDPP